MILALLISSSAAAPKWHQLEGYTFEKYVVDFDKAYDSVEETSWRATLFEQKLEAVRAHNAEPSFTWRRGINHLSDRTAEELKVLSGVDRALLFSERAVDVKPPPSEVGASKRAPSIDWREAGAITPVKNQGHCGSCWAFASTETLESRWFLKTKELQELSEQFILDCTPNPDACGGTGGCGGGTAKLAYERLKQLGGMPSEWTYPYLSGTEGAAGKCHGLPLPPRLEQPHGGSVGKAANASGIVSLPANSYGAIMDALQAGPLTVTVDAGGWHDYEEGVFSGGNHTHPFLDHLVQLVGYGTDAGLGDYFLVRNSWTPRWGELGYIKLARSATPSCGADLRPEDGDGCKDGPPTVEVCGQSGVLYDGAYPLV